MLEKIQRKSPLLHYIDSIEPLEFDLPLFNEYISEISDGIIPQGLVDEVEELYKENNYYRQRRESVDAIGNPNVDFDFYPVHQCLTLMEEFVASNEKPVEFAKHFLDMYEMLDDEYDCDNLANTSKLCKALLNKQIPPEGFVSKVKMVFLNLGKNIIYNKCGNYGKSLLSNKR